jgi:hypothetical protein
MPATSVSVRDATSISAVTPAHEVGTVDVEVVSGQDRSVLQRSFTYERPAVTGERIPLVATVSDDVTPVSSLTFQWTTDRGSVEGTNDRVTFVAGNTAGRANINVTIVERYRTTDARGLPVDAEHRTTGAIAVSVHDELREIGDMAVDFLRLFSMSSVAPQDVVHNFRDNCGANGTGKQDELTQIIANRRNFNILPDWFVGPARPAVSFNGVSPFRARRADGWAAVDVRWRSECKV